jgi:hypothetical protein
MEAEGVKPYTYNLLYACVLQGHAYHNISSDTPDVTPSASTPHPAPWPLGNGSLCIEWGPQKSGVLRVESSSPSSFRASDVQFMQPNW